MEARKVYTKPELKSQQINLGVFGSYCDYQPDGKVDPSSPRVIFQLGDGE